MKERLEYIRDNTNWTNLILGAVIGVIITALLSPLISAPIAHLLVSVGVHDGPEVQTSIEKTGEFYPPGEPVEEFSGLVWNKSYDVYRIEISNTNERPVDRLKLRWNAPGCIAQSNTQGEMIYGEFWLHDRYSLEISTQSKLSIQEMSCTKVLEMTESSLGQGERLAVEFVVTQEFETCDVLVDSNPVNEHELMYRWSAQGAQFTEERTLSPPSLESDYSETREISFIGTQELVETKSGEKGLHYVVGKRGGSFSEAVQQCRA
ncbi:hypothetical protein [Halorubrum sp. Ib24]|uniref:hypothetical protein n=1 Tax=Halorubrum sp. Ib24 TaxID=1383850 RepID=UPI00117A01B8|nr:hypothetical protein [Halorubrum sp. Ib24]